MPPGAVELAVRHNDSEADTDIIAIHGLDTKSPDTWTWRQGDISVNWLSDVNMLPSRVGKARILTCDWSADLLQPKDMSQKSVKEYARLILDGIQRERAEHEDRPIIFIASCLGGIILMQALVMAGSGYSSVCQATRGIVFLSTPFRGTSFKDIAPWAEPTLSIWASATGRAVTGLTKNTTQSSNLEELLRQFTKLVKDRDKESELEPNLKIQLITFYEQQMTKLLHKYLWFSKMKLLVDSDSANLDIVEHPIPLDRPHVLMNKFAGPRDLEYEKVAGRIEDFLRSSRKTFLLDRADAYIKENCEKKLTILRLSGDSLPMNQCYINLAVVEQQGTKTANSAERDAKVSPFSLSHRLSVDTPDKQTQIVLSTIFESRKNGDGTTKTPRRILIRGRAGVGKTTLCKKMVYEFVHEHKWQPMFDRVLWVPLRRLKRWSSASYTFEELFRREVFQNCEEALRYPFVRSLRRALDEDRTLFILDGLDEVSQEWARDHDGYDFLRDLLNQKNVVVTSRPYFKLPDGINPMDLELETLGFYPKQVEEYVNTTFGNSGTQKAEEVRLFLQTHPLIQGLVRIPVQLDALCYNWGGSIDLGSKPETMTAMYQAIENGLWKKDALRLGKIQTENELQSASPKTMERMIEREIGFLESLAFSGLCSDTIEFETRISSTILHNTDDPKNGNPPDKILPRLSFLRTSDPPDSTSGSQQSCHFLHLTYQEYFAARYFVRKWKSGEDLEPFTITDKSGSKRCVRGKGIGTTIFLHQHKYDARYDILWRFVAGLLDSGDGDSDEQDTLRFFQTIDEKPRDLLGPAHQRLLMHCLGEVSPNLLIRPTLEKNLTSWLLFESSFEHASLAREVELPDNVLMAALEDGSNKYNIAVSLNGRPTIPSSIVKLATSWLADDYNDKAAFQILDNSHIKLPNMTLQALVPRLENGDVLSTLEIFGRNSPLPETIIPKIEAKLDADSTVASKASSILSAQPNLTKKAILNQEFQLKSKLLSKAEIQKLRVSLEDNSLTVRYSAVTALGTQPALSEEIVEKLATLLTDDVYYLVRRSAVEALAAQPALSEEIVQRFTLLLKDNKWIVRYAAAEVLIAQPALSEEVLQKITLLLEDDQSSVRNAAAKVLIAQPALSEEVVQKITLLLEDDQWSVQNAAAEVLIAQPALSEEVLQKITLLLEDDQWSVRNAAAGVLAARSSPSEELIQKIATNLECNHLNSGNIVTDSLYQQPMFLKAVLQTLALALGPRIRFMDRSTVAESVLRRHPSFYSGLLDDSHLRGIYEALLKSSFHEQISWCIMDGHSNISTPEGTINVEIKDEQTFWALISEARPSGYPLEGMERC